MLEQQEGVLVALPFGDIGVVEVWSSKVDALPEPRARELIEENDKFTVTGYSAKTVGPD